MIYITTDSHFNHAEKMIQYCQRKSDYEEILSRYYRSLKEEDTLIHLGDVCIGNDQEMHALHIVRAKCKKILCKGNHDNKSTHWYLNNGWDFVCKTFSDKYYGMEVLFSHKPLPWDGIFDINIHGHLHDLSHRADEKGNCMNHLISLEIDGYKPRSLQTVMTDIARSHTRKE